MKYLILIFLFTGCNLELKYCRSWLNCTTIFNIGDKINKPTPAEIREIAEKQSGKK